jgi:hypothetical protein
MRIIAAIEGPPPVEPYLKPEYWNGHRLGDGDAGSLASYKDPGVLQARRSLTYMADYVRAALADGGRPEPIEQLDAGDVLNPRDFAPGTIFSLGREMLMGLSVSPLVDPKYLLPPTRPTMYAKDRHASGATALYRSATLLGTIDRSRDGTQQLIIADGPPLRPSLTAAVLLRKTMQREQQPVHIGETTHIGCDCGRPHDSARPHHEALVRMFGAHMMTEGRISE